MKNTKRDPKRKLERAYQGLNGSRRGLSGPRDGPTWLKGARKCPHRPPKHRGPIGSQKECFGGQKGAQKDNFSHRGSKSVRMDENHES